MDEADRPPGHALTQKEFGRLIRRSEKSPFTIGITGNSQRQSNISFVPWSVCPRFNERNCCENCVAIARACNTLDWSMTRRP